jgi:hypothetical protein
MFMPFSVRASSGQQIKKTLSDQPTISYVNATISEDTTWQGTVLVQGFLTVSPQTTLRIEPGTVVRFMAANNSQQPPRLVVMGRIQCVGTVDRPILLAPNYANVSKGDWGGVLLLSSEKRNLFEHCRIEGAETGLEGRFSTLVTKALAVSKSNTGCLLRDCTAAFTASSFSGCDTGLKVYDSEVEIKDGTFSSSRRGIYLSHSSVVLSSVLVKGCTQQALVAEECRIKCSSSEFSDNVGGAQIAGGEGQIFLSRFIRNRETALHLSNSRLKVSRCLIASNIRVGLKLDDDRATVWGNAISDNGGFNLVYTGQESAHVVQNWWGSRDETFIVAKISTISGTVSLNPWLPEKPAIFP